MKAEAEWNQRGYVLKEYPTQAICEDGRVVFPFLLLPPFPLFYFSFWLQVFKETDRTHLTSELMEQGIQWPHMTKNTDAQKQFRKVNKEANKNPNKKELYN